MTQQTNPIAVFIVGLLFLILWPIVSVFMGAVTGWIVGLCFGTTILSILTQLGITDITMWQVGAFLGFVAAYFRSTFAKKE